MEVSNLSIAFQQIVPSDVLVGAIIEGAIPFMCSLTCFKRKGFNLTHICVCVCVCVMNDLSKHWQDMYATVTIGRITANASDHEPVTGPVRFDSIRFNHWRHN